MKEIIKVVIQSDLLSCDSESESTLRRLNFSLSQSQINCLSRWVKTDSTWIYVAFLVLQKSIDLIFGIYLPELNLSLSQ